MTIRPTHGSSGDIAASFSGSERGKTEIGLDSFGLTKFVNMGLFMNINFCLRKDFNVFTTKRPFNVSNKTWWIHYTRALLNLFITQIFFKEKPRHSKMFPIHIYPLTNIDNKRTESRTITDTWTHKPGHTFTWSPMGPVGPARNAGFRFPL